MRVDGYAVPDPLKDMGIWTVWNCVDKMPLAPWQTGHMFPATWGQDTPADDRPEVSYERAKSVADLEPDVIHETWPFPTDDDGTPQIPEEVKPGIILPHYKTQDRVLMFVDFDDVRDPETGEVTEEVVDIVERLGAYAEVSRSGTGLHCYVFAELPDGLGRFIGDLDDKGHIELYDHGRFTGGTWNHVAGTPMTVPEAQDTVDEIIEEYEDQPQQERRERGARRPDKPEDIDQVLAEIRGDDQSDTNRYFQLDVEDVAHTGYFATHSENRTTRGWRNGPHPEHGPKKSSVENCTNFGVNPTENVWKCWVHDGGHGGALHLIAVLEGVLSCDRASYLMDDSRDVLEVCLHARDDYTHGELDGEDPPYAALVAVANQHDLVMADEDENRLGKDAWRIARVIYENMTAADVEY